ncbi:MAG: hypothetical protein LBE18_12820 [Planctomycetaceae bacterium]|jgi:hypothetical protein|nr:hypothetical protein [Planctomycetaceae bacterium]
MYDKYMSTLDILLSDCNILPSNLFSDKEISLRKLGENAIGFKIYNLQKS